MENKTISDFFKRIGKREEKKQDSQYREHESSTSTYRQSMRQENFKQQPLQTIKHEGQHIVISDLHGNMDRWECVKKAIQQNPNMHVTILGDAMDRGDYGIEILLQIKELSDEGKVDYLPGNHDVFTYNYVQTEWLLSKLSDEYKARLEGQRTMLIASREKKHLMMNGGEQTIEGLENFEQLVKKELIHGNIKNNITKASFIKWLGSQPIQKKIQVNGKEYALAHAYFDDDLYTYDKKFNLEKALYHEIMGQERRALNKFKTTIWYREGDETTYYSPVTFPQGCVMVVGHTPQEKINIVRLHQDPNKMIIYIDTGYGKFAGWNLTNGTAIQLNSKNKYAGGR